MDIENLSPFDLANSELFKNLSPQEKTSIIEDFSSDMSEGKAANFLRGANMMMERDSRNQGVGRVYLENKVMDSLKSVLPDGYNDLDKDSKLSAIDKALPILDQRAAEIDPVNKNDTAFYARRQLTQEMRSILGEDVSEVGDKSKRFLGGVIQSIAAPFDEEGTTEFLARNLPTKPEYDQTNASVLTQAAGDFVGQIGMIMGAAAAITASGGTAGVAFAGSTALGLAQNSSRKFQENYNLAKADMGLSDDEALAAGMAGMPGAVIDSFGDALLLRGIKLGTVGKAFKSMTATEKAAEIVAKGGSILKDPKALRTFGANFIKGGLTEGVSESLGDAATAWGGYATSGHEGFKPSAESLWQSFWVGGLLGGTFSSIANTGKDMKNTRSLQELGKLDQAQFVALGEDAHNQIADLMDKENYTGALEVVKKFKSLVSPPTTKTPAATTTGSQGAAVTPVVAKPKVDASGNPIELVDQKEKSDEEVAAEQIRIEDAVAGTAKNLRVAPENPAIAGLKQTILSAVPNALNAVRAALQISPETAGQQLAGQKVTLGELTTAITSLQQEKSNATKAGKKQQDNQQQPKDAAQGGQAAQTGDSNSAQQAEALTRDQFLQAALNMSPEQRAEASASLRAKFDADEKLTPDQRAAKVKEGVATEGEASPSFIITPNEAVAAQEEINKLLAEIEISKKQIEEVKKNPAKKRAPKKAAKKAETKDATQEIQEEQVPDQVEPATDARGIVLKRIDNMLMLARYKSKIIPSFAPQLENVKTLADNLKSRVNNGDLMVVLDVDADLDGFENDGEIISKKDVDEMISFLSDRLEIPSQQQAAQEAISNIQGAEQDGRLFQDDQGADLVSKNPKYKALSELTPKELEAALSIVKALQALGINDQVSDADKLLALEIKQAINSGSFSDELISKLNEAAPSRAIFQNQVYALKGFGKTTKDTIMKHFDVMALNFLKTGGSLQAFWARVPDIVVVDAVKGSSTARGSFVTQGTGGKVVEDQGRVQTGELVTDVGISTDETVVSIPFSPVPNRIVLVRGKYNASTMYHENDHNMIVTGMFQQTLESQEGGVQLYEEVLVELGAKRGEPWTVAQHEKFVRAREAWINGGEVNSVFTRVFNALKTIFTNLYTSGALTKHRNQVLEKAFVKVYDIDTAPVEDIKAKVSRETGYEASKLLAHVPATKLEHAQRIMEAVKLNPDLGAAKAELIVLATTIQGDAQVFADDEVFAMLGVLEQVYTGKQVPLGLPLYDEVDNHFAAVKEIYTYYGAVKQKGKPRDQANVLFQDSSMETIAIRNALEQFSDELPTTREAPIGRRSFMKGIATAIASLYVSGCNNETVKDRIARLSNQVKTRKLPEQTEKLINKLISSNAESSVNIINFDESISLIEYQTQFYADRPKDEVIETNVINPDTDKPFTFTASQAVDTGRKIITQLNEKNNEWNAAVRKIAGIVSEITGKDVSNAKIQFPDQERDIVLEAALRGDIPNYGGQTDSENTITVHPNVLLGLISDDIKTRLVSASTVANELSHIAQNNKKSELGLEFTDDILAIDGEKLQLPEFVDSAYKDAMSSLYSGTPWPKGERESFEIAWVATKAFNKSMDAVIDINEVSKYISSAMNGFIDARSVTDETILSSASRRAYSDVTLFQDSSMETVVTREQDQEYLALAADPEANQDTLQAMVNDVAKAAGYNRKGVRFGFYVGGVPLTPSIGNQNFGSGYYVAEDAVIDTSASSVSVDPTPNKKSLEELGLTEEEVTFRRDSVFIKAQAPLPKTLSESEEAFVNAEIAYQSAINDAYSATGKYGYLDSSEIAKLRKSPTLDSSIRSGADFQNRQRAIAMLIRDKKLPYDSIRGMTGREGMSSELVVQQASQIKSADPVTYDSNGNVIPLSQRFNQQSDSILYQDSSMETVEPQTGVPYSATVYRATPLKQGNKPKIANEGSLGSGIYLAGSRGMAEYYLDFDASSGGSLSGRRLAQFSVNLQNPIFVDNSKFTGLVDALESTGLNRDKVIDRIEKNTEDRGAIGKWVQAAFQKAGYDGIIARRNDGSIEIVAYSANSIVETSDIIQQAIAPRTTNQLFQFAGETAQRSQFLTDSLDTAKAMAAAGKTQEEIRAITGWFPSPYDGKMRWEIPDDEAKLKRMDWFFYKEEASISSILNHQAFYEAYPDAKQIKVKILKLKKGILGAFDGNNTIKISGRLSEKYIKNLLLHEIQHWIQSKEGFARGSNTNKFYKQKLEGLDGDAVLSQLYDLSDNVVTNMDSRDVETIINDVNSYYQKNGLSIRDVKNPAKAEKVIFAWRNAITELGINGLYSSIDQFEKTKNKIESIESDLEYLYNDSYNEYVSTAGEIEARNIEARANFTPEQRAAIAPYSSENIAPEEAIVLFQVQETSGYSDSAIRGIIGMGHSMLQMAGRLNLKIDNNKIQKQINTLVNSQNNRSGKPVKGSTVQKAASALLKSFQEFHGNLDEADQGLLVKLAYEKSFAIEDAELDADSLARRNNVRKRKGQPIEEEQRVAIQEKVKTLYNTFRNARTNNFFKNRMMDQISPEFEKVANRILSLVNRGLDNVMGAFNSTNEDLLLRFADNIDAYNKKAYQGTPEFIEQFNDTVTEVEEAVMEHLVRQYYAYNSAYIDAEGISDEINALVAQLQRMPEESAMEWYERIVKVINQIEAAMFSIAAEGDPNGQSEEDKKAAKVRSKREKMAQTHQAALLEKFPTVDDFIAYQREKDGGVLTPEFEQILRDNYDNLVESQIEDLSDTDLRVYNSTALTMIVGGSNTQFLTLPKRQWREAKVASWHALVESMTDRVGQSPLVRSIYRSASRSNFLERQLNNFDKVFQANVENFHVWIDRFSQYAPVRNWFDRQFFADFQASVFTQAENARKAAESWSQDTIDQYNDETDTTVDANPYLWVMSMLSQYNLGADPNKEFSKAVTRARTSIQRTIDQKRSVMLVGTANKNLAALNYMLEGIDPEADNSYDLFMNNATVGNRIGSGNEAKANKRLELLSNITNYFQQDIANQKFIRENIFGKPFQTVVNYLPLKALKVDGTLDEWDWTNIEPNAEYQQAAQNVNARSNEERVDSLGQDRAYGMDFFNMVERKAVKNALDKHAIMPVAILSDMFKTEEKIIDGVSYRVPKDNAIKTIFGSQPEVVGQLAIIKEKITHQMVQIYGATEPATGFVGGIRKALSVVQGSMLSGVGQIAQQSTAAVVDYAAREEGNIGYMIDAMIYWSKNYNKYRDWLLANNKDLYERGNTQGIREFERHVNNAGSELNSLLDKGWQGIDQIRKFMTISLRYGDKIGAELIFLAEHMKAVKQSGQMPTNGDYDISAYSNPYYTAQAQGQLAKFVGPSSAAGRSYWMSDHKQHYFLLRSLTGSFQSSAHNMSSQMLAAARNIVALQSDKSPEGKAERIAEYRKIGSIMAQQATFTGMRYLVGAMIGYAFVGAIKDAWDDEDGAIEEAQLALEAAKSKSYPSKAAKDMAVTMAERRLADAKSIRRSVIYVKQQSSGDALFKSMVRDQLQNLHIAGSVGDGFVPKLFMMVPNSLAEQSHGDAQDLIISSLKKEKSEALAMGNRRKAAQISESILNAQAIEYIPYFYDKKDKSGFGGIVGGMLDPIFSSVKEGVEDMTRADKDFLTTRAFVPDMITYMAAIGLGQADVNRIARQLQRMDDDLSKNRDEANERAGKEVDKLTNKSKTPFLR